MAIIVNLPATPKQNKQKNRPTDLTDTKLQSKAYKGGKEEALLAY